MNRLDLKLSFGTEGLIMDANVSDLPIEGLVLAFVPALVVIAIIHRWNADVKTALYATLRMLVQLMLIGYVLTYIFTSEHPMVVLAILLFMLVVSGWIAMRPVKDASLYTYLNALVAIAVGGVCTLLLVSQLVLKVEPWFSPRFLVPLAGMIFAGAMNTVSLAAERFQSESDAGVVLSEARRIAFQASLIPMINSLFAVGLVSLPGMMTGQILSGIAPTVAAKYQIVMMTMLFGASGISAAVYLVLTQRRMAVTKLRPRRVESHRGT